MKDLNDVPFYGGTLIRCTNPRACGLEALAEDGPVVGTFQWGMWDMHTVTIDGIDFDIVDLSHWEKAEDTNA